MVVTAIEYKCLECKEESIAPIDMFCWHCRNTVEIFNNVETDRFPYARKEVVFQHINDCFTLILSEDGWESRTEFVWDDYDGHWTEITYEEITPERAIQILADKHHC